MYLPETIEYVRQMLDDMQIGVYPSEDELIRVHKDLLALQSRMKKAQVYTVVSKETFDAYQKFMDPEDLGAVVSYKTGVLVPFQFI